VLVEVGQFRSEAEDVLHFTHQNAIQLVDILFDVALGLFDLLEDAHILLDYVNNVVDVLSVLRNQRLFLLQNHLD
jgi:hypothetical protein